MRIECRGSLFYAAIVSLFLAVFLSFTACSNPEKTKAAHLAKGEAYLKESKFQEASIEFRNALQIDDSLAAAHWGLAKAYEGLERWPEFFDELRRTIDLDKNNLEARAKLANFYLLSSKRNPDNLTEAERLATEILKKDPNYIEGHILMGSIFFAKNQPDEALKELNKAIEIDPKRVESYLSMAR